MDDINIRYLNYYYQKYGTINDISTLAVVEFEGQIVKVGNFLANKRRRYKDYLDGKSSPTKASLLQFEILNEMDFNWTPSEKDDITTDDPYISYLVYHYEKHGTINNISRKDIVEYNGETLRIGAFLNATRTRHRAYLRHDFSGGSASKTSIERYNILEKLQIEWDPLQKNREASLADDKYLRYLKDHYAKHKTINDIAVRDVVMFEGELLKIGNFLADIRANRRKYLGKKDSPMASSELSLLRYKELDKLGMDWNPENKNLTTSKDDDILMRCIISFYEQNGSLEELYSQEFIEFEGKVLNIRQFIYNIRARHADYQNGINRNGSFSENALKRYKELDKMHFSWNVGKSIIVSLSEANQISYGTLYNYTKKFGGDTDKALMFCLREKKLNQESETLKLSKYPLSKFLQEFDINIETLISYLNRRHVKTSKNRSVLKYTPDMSLMEFCTENGYNYTIISRMVRVRKNGSKDESLESLVEKCLAEQSKSTQQKPSTWIYGKYGNELLLKHILLSIGLDSASILRDMTWNIIDIDEAIMRECFRKSSHQDYSYLQGPYQDFVYFYKKVSNQENYQEEQASNDLLLFMQSLIETYHLTKEEYDIITKSFKAYTDAIYQYHLCEVAFEKDSQKKVEKIVAYRFDADDIEESFFIPLRFSNKVILEKDSKLYKRRIILKNLTVSWNYLTREEQNRKAKQYELSRDELTYIGKTRSEIDLVKKKVYRYHQNNS